MRYFFIHIPKTAGTSFRNLLYSNLEERKIVSAYMGDRVFNDLIQNPQKYRHKQYFIGHFNYGLHRILGFDAKECRYITFLRHPVERVISLYKHFARHSGTLEYDLIHKRGLSLSQFLQLATYSQMSNHIVKILTNVDLETAINHTHLEIALKNIAEHFMYIGSMNDYQHSINELCDLFSWYQRPVIYQNRALIQQEFEFNDQDKSEIIAFNHYDLQLYQLCYLAKPFMRNQQIYLSSLNKVILTADLT